MSRVMIVAPALNEADGLDDFIREIGGLRDRLAGDHELRLLIVDDGSTDDTLGVLRRNAASLSEWFGYLSFAANAGHQAALVAGLAHAGTWADAIVTMDSDLEHPVDVVPQLIEAWSRTGALIVHAIRAESAELPWQKRWPSAAFYRLTAWLTGLDLTPGQADFRLWDAATMRGVRSYLPHIGSLRVFAAWLPGRKAAITYQQRVRPERQSRFTLKRNLELAAISVIRFSHLPLSAITILGATGLLFSLIYGAFFIAPAAAAGSTVPGWPSLILTVMVMGCLQLVAIGVLATYLRRLVFARDLPPFIVRESSPLVEPMAAGRRADELR